MGTYRNVGPAAYRGYKTGETLILEDDDEATLRALARGTLELVGTDKTRLERSRVKPPLEIKTSDSAAEEAAPDTELPELELEPVHPEVADPENEGD